MKICESPCGKRKNIRWYFHLFGTLLLFLTSGLSLLVFPFSPTSTPSSVVFNPVMFSVVNFNTALLSATADDLSSGNCCLFHIQNGTPWWYGITTKSVPKNTQIQPNVAQTDLVSATFFGSVPLLPPVNVLPFDQPGNSVPFEMLQLQTSLSSSDQRVQLTLTPFETHAVMLDALALISQVLGQRLSAFQMGLLLPGTLTEVFAQAATMKDFTALTSDYIRVLSSMPNAVSIEKYAQSFATDMRALFADPWEQTMLSDLLWKMEGKVISQESILSVIQGFAQVQFELAVTDFVVDTILTQAAIFDRYHLPTVSLQTPITITPTPKPTPTPRPTPTPKPTPTPRPTPTPKPTPTSVPTPKPPPAAVPTVVVTIVVTIMATATR